MEEHSEERVEWSQLVRATRGAVIGFWLWAAAAAGAEVSAARLIGPSSSIKLPPKVRTLREMSN
jgi:hypothetical protein